MNYEETIEHLYAQLPMFSRIGAAAYKEDLHNTIALCQFLGNPHHQFKSVHIAGTNGKGSTSHMLAAIFQQAGYKTGLYTSPHLVDFRERIRINGEMISKQFVIDFVEKTKSITEEIQPSFFELTVGMAFDYFAAEKVDIAIIETGLGGRLDSTNIITPLLSIITNIGYDHMQILGDTLSAIAREKAGIIKTGVPVVIGEYLTDTKPVFESTATALKSPIVFASEKLTATNIRYQSSKIDIEIIDKGNSVTTNYTLDLNGLYQANNLLTVLCSVSILRQKGFQLPEKQLAIALSKVKALTGLHGRWEVVAEDPDIILDVAHNEDGIRQILGQLKTNYNTTKIHLVIGMVKDKEVEKVLSLLPADASYYFTQSHIPRALPAAELQSKAAMFGLTGASFENVNLAIQAARQNAEKKSLILVCGSVFLVGEVKVEVFN